MTSDAQKAIAAAMSGNWEEAEKLNLEILNATPQDIDALNRLGRAYLEQGKKSQARKTFQKVLKLDRYNTIAQRNLDFLKGAKTKKGGKIAVSPDIFIEEPGKTKTIFLTKPADKKTISGLSVGEEVKLQVRKHSIACYSQDDTYLGRLPDDLSSRLIKFINAGNKYQVFIKSLNFPEIKVFIREIKRAKRLEDYPSFPVKGEPSYLAFFPPELVHEERPEIKSSEEDEEITKEQA